MIAAMRFYFFVLTALLLLSSLPLPAAVIPADARADHNACVKKGFILGKMEDPTTESYYNCRAEIAASHIIKPSLTGKLAPDEAENNELMTKIARSFADKAQAAREYRSSGSQVSLGRWEDEQSATARSFDAHDHKACLDRGFNPTVWGNPDTEQYYLCRAQIIEQRAPALPAIGSNYEKRAPQAALFFYQKAREAQYAFRAVDYQTHHLCLDKGIYPGEWEDPKTQQYYLCRADLARDTMGDKVVAIFKGRAARAAQAAADNGPCAAKGLKNGTEPYARCRAAILSYRKCLGEIDSKLLAQRAQDQQNCQDEATLKYPPPQESHTKKASAAADRRGALRSQAYDLCMREKDDTRARSGGTILKLQCDELMNFDHPAGSR